MHEAHDCIKRLFGIFIETIIARSPSPQIQNLKSTTTMRHFVPPYILCILLVQLFTGCSGLKLGNKGKYFQMTLQENFDPNTVRRVGVYVFSQVEERNAARKVELTPDEIIDRAILSTVLLNMQSKHYPPKVTPDTKFNPDTASSGPSLELAIGIQNELEKRGYKAEVFMDVGHNRTVTVQQCLAHAREQGMDAAFIVGYREITHWQKPPEAGFMFENTIVDGFLFLPNSGFFNAKTEEMIWSNNYYGLVETAHVMNFVDEEFTRMVPGAIVNSGAETYFDAVAPAVELIFTPKYWPESQKPFPSRREKGAEKSF